MRRISSDVFFSADEQTTAHFDVPSSADEDGDAATSSLLAVVQQRQEPQRIVSYGPHVTRLEPSPFFPYDPRCHQLEQKQQRGALLLRQGQPFKRYKQRS